MGRGPPEQSATARSRLSVALAAALGLTVTAWSVNATWASMHRDAQLRFARLADATLTEVPRRAMFPQYALRGAIGALAAVGQAPDRAAFARYVATRDLGREFPGALGLGFITHVERDALPRFVASARADGAPDFAITGDGERDDLWVIQYIEPLVDNRAALGFDVGSEPTRRAAIERAVRDGLPAVTRRIELVQARGRGPGFLLFIPYFGPGAAPANADERAARLQGVVSATLLAEPLFREVSDDTNGLVDVELFDAETPDIAKLIFDADHHLDGVAVPSSLDNYADRWFVQTSALDVGGNRWSVRLSSTPKFEQTIDTSRPVYVGLAGLCLTALLVYSAWTQWRSQAVAVALARRMTASLRDSEARAQKLAMVASRTDNSVVIADAMGRIEWVNDGFTRVTGYSLDEVAGKRPGSFLHGSETDRTTVAEMADTIVAGRVCNAEILNYHKSGRCYWQQLEVQPIRNDDGRIQNFISIASDVTARRETDDRLREALHTAREATIAAQQASVAKSRFLATMSHEIRTPLNGVIGMTSLMQGTPLSSEQQEFVQIIQNSGQALLVLINDILDYSKIESGKVELERRPVVVRECIEGVLDLLESAAASHGIDLLCDVDAAVPEALVGDGTRVRQVLMNLVGNAIKFTSAGEVEVSARTLSMSAGGCELAFAVRDTGVGIPVEAQSKLFTSFTQVDASTTRRFGGTGLGLAISRGLVELMGGRIWLESAPGAGSTFHFTLPFGTDPEATASNDAPPALSGRSALVVDDNAAGRRIVGGLLERWGARPVLAANVTEALAALEQPVDLVVLDAAIPGADGLAETIRARSGARAPIIQISARGHREGPPDEATVTRPVKLRGLADAISHALTPGPTRRAAPVAAPAAPAIVHADRVLLAEDNPVNQKVATHMLRRLGYAADVAENGAAAVAAVTREPYDVVLMDMQMPVMDGLEATRRIVAGEHFGAHRPHIIALTANAMAEDEAQCLAAGMDAFLTKPLDPERLSRALQDARERRAALA